MKICMVLRDSFPSDIRVKREAKYLLSQGHEVHLLCAQSETEPGVETIDGIRVKRIPKLRPPVRYAEELFYHVSLVSVQWKREIRRYLDEGDFDILHVHDLPPLPTALKAAEDRNIAVTADFHELFPESVVEWRKGKSMAAKLHPSVLLRPARRLKRAEKKCIERIDGLITVSPEQLEYYKRDYDLSNVETDVVRNVPDLERLNQIPIDTLEFDGFVVGYVGTFSAQRGLETLIDSFAQFRGEVDEATLLLVGDGNDNYLSRLKSRCSARGILDDVEFTGWVDFEKVPTYLSASDVSLCPWVGDSIDSKCTLPNKLFQSMYFETPVIVSDLDSMRNVVTETDCGVVVKQESPESLTNALTELHGNPARRRELGQNGKRAVESKYNFQKEIERLNDLYRRVGQ